MIGRPPFSIVDEEALFRRLNVDILVVKNSGGLASRTKLDAAQLLGISVLMIVRPPSCGALTVQNLSDVVHWMMQWKS